MKSRRQYMPQGPYYGIFVFHQDFIIREDIIKNWLATINRTSTLILKVLYAKVILIFKDWFMISLLQKWSDFCFEKSIHKILFEFQSKNVRKKEFDQKYYLNFFVPQNIILIWKNF